MDYYSKYPDYRHHPMNGMGTNGIIGNNLNPNVGITNGGINGSYYSHPPHPSMRYQQSMYRMGTPGGYNGIGPPSMQPPTSNLYLNYERYSSYPNLPSYGYNTPNYNYGHLNVRDMNGYYNHYENYSRLGGFSYHNYREMYDGGIMHGSRNNNSYMPMYGHPVASREFHPNNNLYHHSHHYPHHYQPHHNISKDTYMSQMPDIGQTSNNDVHKITDIGSVNDISAFNSVITPRISPLNNVITSSNNCSANINGARPMNLEYSTSSSSSSSGATYLGNNNHHNSTNDLQYEPQQQHIQQISPDGVQHQHSTGFPFGNKEIKSKKTSRDKDKSLVRLSTNRKLDCSPPVDTTNLDRADTPIVSHSNRYSPANCTQRLQNGYSSNQSNTNCSPYSNSSQNWNHQYSPKTNRKRIYSPQPDISPTPLSFVNKNRVLECDFIPSKKSRRKASSETTEVSFEFREEIKNITPLPGFQQAFGSTEIGRFSETFFNITPESPIEPPYESEADTLSPQPWETGDSLEGPHFNLHIGASVQPVYSENHSSVDSPVESNYFSEIGCSDY